MPTDDHLQYLADICHEIVDNSFAEKLDIWEMKVNFNRNYSDAWKVSDNS